MTSGRAIAGTQIGALGLQPREEWGIAQQPVLDRLGVAGKEVAPVQGLQHADIGQHQPRLVEGAEQILAVPGVDARFAADGTVNLGQKCGRDMDEVKAAQHDCGGESRDVADDAAAQRDQGRGALNTGVEKTVCQVLQVRQVLGGLAGRQHDANVLQSRLAEGYL